MPAYFQWEDKFDRQLLLSKLSSCRTIKSGSCSFNGGDYAFWLPVLNSAIRATAAVGSLKARSIEKAVGDASVNLNDQNAFLLRCDKAFDDLIKRPKKKFVLYSTITFSGPKFINWMSDEGSRIYWQPSAKGTFHRNALKGREKLSTLRTSHKVSDDSADQTAVLVHVTAYDHLHAYEIANDSMDRLRGMLNLLVNSTRGINPFGRHFHTPHAVNRFRRGPYQTLHNADGTLAVEMFWYEPRWQHDSETVKFQDSPDNWKKVLYDSWSKFQRNPLREHISEALLRYCRALDLHDAEPAVLGIWGALECLTGTQRLNYDVTVSRIVRLFKDHEDARLIANHVRLRRNSMIHSSRSIGNDESDAILLQSETLVGQAIFFCLNQGHNFKDKRELFDFLDFPLARDVLIRKQRLGKFFLKYQNRI
jgi:hypothetical protein